MKKALIIIIFGIVVFLFTSCTKQQKKIEIYSFHGENETIMINNGLIIVTDDLEKFIGGDLTFKVEEPSNVKYSKTKFFFYKNGIENTILSNSQNIEGSIEGTPIQKNLGSTSSENLFYNDDLEQIKNSLNFSVSGNLINEENFEYHLVLDIKKVY